MLDGRAGGLSSPAGAQVSEPTVHTTCEVSGGTETLGAVLAGVPASETFHFFAIGTFEDGSTVVFDGFTVTVDASGSGSTIRVALPRPLDVGFAVYRDTNNNGRWNVELDDTLYRGNGRVTDCPQDVLLSPE